MREIIIGGVVFVSSKQIQMGRRVGWWECDARKWKSIAVAV